MKMVEQLRIMEGDQLREHRQIFYNEMKKKGQNKTNQTIWKPYQQSTFNSQKGLLKTNKR